MSKSHAPRAPSPLRQPMPELGGPADGLGNAARVALLGAMPDPSFAAPQTDDVEALRAALDARFDLEVANVDARGDLARSQLDAQAEALRGGLFARFEGARSRLAELEALVGARLADAQGAADAQVSEQAAETRATLSERPALEQGEAPLAVDVDGLGVDEDLAAATADAEALLTRASAEGAGQLDALRGGLQEQAQAQPLPTIQAPDLEPAGLDASEDAALSGADAGLTEAGAAIDEALTQERDHLNTLRAQLHAELDTAPDDPDGALLQAVDGGLQRWRRASDEGWRASDRQLAEQVVATLGAADGQLGEAVGQASSAAMDATMQSTSALQQATAQETARLLALGDTWRAATDHATARWQTGLSEGRAAVGEGFRSAASTLRADLDTLREASFSDLLSMGLDALLGRARYSFQQSANLAWGFVWGEAWFPEIPGAEAAAFTGDVVAGLLQYGDLRDLVKYCVVYPLKGRGPWWLLGGLGALAVIGLIPLVGDAVKAVVKRSVTRAARGTLSGLAERLGRERYERLAVALSDDSIERLADELGEEGLARLSREIGPTWVKRYVAQLGLKRTVEIAQRYGGRAMLHYGVDWFKAFKGFAPDFAHHLKVGDGVKNAKSGVNGCHDAATFERMYISPATERQVVVRKEVHQGPYTYYDYSLMKADGSGPKASVLPKTVVKGLSDDWGTWWGRIESAIDASIRDGVFPVGGDTIGGIQIVGVPWVGYFRNGKITTLFPKLPGA
ncbi:MAG: hypothetical protein H6739_36790 [Alphaproteobacteria bacterium]|nr:hypothetical protein [Alphaproteobacteria bacterium]